MNARRTAAALVLATLAVTGAGMPTASATDVRSAAPVSAGTQEFAPRPSTLCIRILKAYKRGDVKRRYAARECNYLLRSQREGMRVVRWAERPGHRWALALIS